MSVPRVEIECPSDHVARAATRESPLIPRWKHGDGGHPVRDMRIRTGTGPDPRLGNRREDILARDCVPRQRSGPRREHIFKSRRALSGVRAAQDRQYLVELGRRPRPGNPAMATGSALPASAPQRDRTMGSAGPPPRHLGPGSGRHHGHQPHPHPLDGRLDGDRRRRRACSRPARRAGARRRRRPAHLHGHPRRGHRRHAGAHDLGRRQRQGDRHPGYGDHQPRGRRRATDRQGRPRGRRCRHDRGGGRRPRPRASPTRTSPPRTSRSIPSTTTRTTPPRRSAATSSRTRSRSRSAT